VSPAPTPRRLVMEWGFVLIVERPAGACPVRGEESDAGQSGESGDHRLHDCPAWPCIGSALRFETPNQHQHPRLLLCIRNTCLGQGLSSLKWGARTTSLRLNSMTSSRASSFAPPPLYSHYWVTSTPTVEGCTHSRFFDSVSNLIKLKSSLTYCRSLGTVSQLVPAVEAHLRLAHFQAIADSRPR
jgi:hypothetical protein